MSNTTTPEPPTPLALAPADGSAKPEILAVIAYKVDAPEGHEVRVALTDIAKEMLATLTDFELKVFAAEVSLIVRKRFEMPPSPNAEL